MIGVYGNERRLDIYATDRDERPSLRMCLFLSWAGRLSTLIVAEGLETGKGRVVYLISRGLEAVPEVGHVVHVILAL